MRKNAALVPLLALIACCGCAGASLACLQTTFLAFQAQAQRLDAVVVYQQARPSLVVITVRDEQGRTKLGSGVILSSDGLVATNYHVIGGALSARVKLANGDEYVEVVVVDTDEQKDIALLKVRAANLPAMQLANSENLQVGQTVYVLGAPLGLEASLSQGLVSSIRQGSEIHPKLQGFRVIQFTAPISPGNSGGPLLDDSGKVMGMVFASIPSGQNLNLAVPANYISALIANPGSKARTLPPMSNQTVTSTPLAVPQLLSSAKTLCVLVPSGSPVLQTEISKKLIAWGKLALVSSPGDADLVLRVVQTGRLDMATGAGNQATAVLIHRESGAQLWGVTKGGSWAMSSWSEAWVGRAIAGEFIKFYSSVTKGARKP